jgi:hypothetical protein
LKPMRIHKSPIFKFLEFIDSSSSTLDVWTQTVVFGDGGIC